MYVRRARSTIRRLADSRQSPYRSILRNVEPINDLVILDIGANIGQFGIDIRGAGFRGKIISFEPVAHSHRVLRDTIARFQPWDSFPIGLGSVEGDFTINVSGNNALSTSMLTMNSIHLENFPSSATTHTENIKVSTVDKQLSLLGLDPSKVLLKLDVQGFEFEVLKGATGTLPLIPYCYLEVSLIPLYEGERIFLEILNELANSGHQLVDVQRGIKSAKGELLQLDILTKLSHRK